MPRSSVLQHHPPSRRCPPRAVRYTHPRSRAMRRTARAALAAVLAAALALAATPLAAALRLGALTAGSGTPPADALHDGPAHVARAWATAPVVPGRLCPAGSVIGEYVRRHQLMHPPNDFGNGGGAGNAWMQRNWEPHLRCVGEVRMGPAGDGGKHVCDPDCLLERGDCVIYSFGSNNDFGFENSLLPYKCQIHVFDHTVANPTPPEGVTFHRYGIQASGSSANMKSLPAIIEELQHSDTIVDIMKIDVEGAEFAVFADASTQAALKKHVRQVLLEVHYKTEAGTVALAQQLTNTGFYTFSKEPNIQWSSGDCVEFSLLNVNLV